jgi:hypothetical protein
MKHPLTKMAPPVRSLKDPAKTETPQQRKTGIKIVNPITKGDRLANTYESGRMNKSRS